MTDKTLEQALRLLLAWYRENARVLPFRGTRDPYRIWISEIMLQQTRAGAVIRYYDRFTEALPDVFSLAEVPDDELMKLWEGLGYYSRARNLKKCAQVLVKEYGGQFPEEYDELLRLPGIGFYTAGAIASIAFGRPVPAVDGNVMRVMSRLGNDDSDVMDMKTKRAVFERLSQAYGALAGSSEADSASGSDKTAGSSSVSGKNDDHRFGDLNQAFMDLGSEICIPKTPRCAECPLEKLCEARQAGEDRPSQLPVRKKAAPKRTEKRTILIIGAGDDLLLHRRPDKGLLAGLYEFPGKEGHLSEDGALQAVKDFGFEPLHIKRLPDAKHVFSHVIWDMICYRVKVADRGNPGERQAGENSGLRAGSAERAAETVADAAGAYDPEKHNGTWLWVSSRDAGKEVPIPSAFAMWFTETGIKEE
jgi:A/G-specific adenine glycosylase